MGSLDYGSEQGGLDIDGYGRRRGGEQVIERTVEGSCSRLQESKLPHGFCCSRPLVQQRPPWAGGVATVEAADDQTDADLMFQCRKISRMSVVTAVYALARGAALGAVRLFWRLRAVMPKCPGPARLIASTWQPGRKESLFIRHFIWGVGSASATAALSIPRKVRQSRQSG